MKWRLETNMGKIQYWRMDKKLSLEGLFENIETVKQPNKKNWLSQWKNHLAVDELLEEICNKSRPELIIVKQ